VIGTDVPQRVSVYDDYFQILRRLFLSIILLVRRPPIVHDRVGSQSTRRKFDELFEKNILDNVLGTARDDGRGLDPGYERSFEELPVQMPGPSCGSHTHALGKNHAISYLNVEIKHLAQIMRFLISTLRKNKRACKSKAISYLNVEINKTCTKSVSA
jgi:hypothetical protein